MLWVDAVVKVAACTISIIATLQATSRGLHIMEHDAIGIMEGPLIQNKSTPIFELSESFRHAVLLSMNPRLYSNVTIKDLSPPEQVVVAPYSLYPSPRIERDVKKEEPPSVELEKSSLDAFLDEQVEHFLEEADDDADQSTNEPEQTNSIWKSIRQFPGAISDAISPSYERSVYIVQSTPQLLKYWAKRVWYKAQGKKLKSLSKKPESSGTTKSDDGIPDSSDWDYDLARETSLSYNSSVTGNQRTSVVSAYAPKAFDNLRSLFGIRDIDYHFSLFGSGPFVSFQSNSKGAARVGGVFFFSRDGAYMIKTIKKEEVGALLKLLPKYHKHMKRHGRQSLLTRFCGMYSVRIKDGDDDEGTEQTFVVMNSVFPAEASKFIAERFDLKGSTVGREVSKEERQKKGRNAVLKDLDLAREVELVKKLEQSYGRRLSTRSQLPSYGFQIGATAKAMLLSQLRHDVKLLVECQVMDYSLLVGVVLLDDPIELDSSAHKALETLEQQGLDRYKNQREKKKVDTELLLKLATPIRLLLSPTLYLSRQAWQVARRTVSTILPLPLPYHGAGECVVDGGSLAMLHGTRRGQRAIYYFGLIDFLQPWTTRKVLERKVKGLLGQDIHAISCVTPEEYAERFLKFLDSNIT